MEMRKVGCNSGRDNSRSFSLALLIGGDRGFHKLRREILWRLFVQIWRTDDCLVFVGVLLEAGGVPFFYIGTVSHGFVEDLSAHIVCSAKRTLSWLNLPRLTTGGFERRPMLATSYKRVLLS